MAEFDCTMGNIARPEVTGYFDCDTIAVSSSPAIDSDMYRIQNPGSELSAFVILDHVGFQILEVEVNVGTATGASVLVREV